MVSDIYWIETPLGLRLATMARPRAGDWLEDEIDHWVRQGVGRVVSLLEPHEVHELGLEAEAAMCAARSIDFVSYPIADRGTPEDTCSAARLARRILDDGTPTAIHCRAGIGRASLIAGAVLVTAGMASETAWAAIAKARGLPVPDTEVQRLWLANLTPDEN